MRLPSVLSPTHIANLFILTPLLLTQLPFKVPPFSPRQPIYSNNLIPLLLAPVSPPASFFPLISRIIQATILIHLPSRWYIAWLSIAAVRCAVGHLLSRGVGWAYPFLFVHSALYEEISGLGPVFALSFTFNAAMGWPLVALMSNGYGSTGRRSDISGFKVPGVAWAQQFPQLSSALLVVSLCILDNAPWSYGIGATLGLILSSLDALKTRYLPSQDRRDPDSLPLSSSQPHSLSSSSPSSTAPGAPTRALLIMLGGIVFFQLSSLGTYLTKSQPVQPAVSFHIIILSYPRPSTTPESLLAETIDSYLPQVNKHTSLTIYTAVPDHQVFLRTRSKYANDHRIGWWIDPASADTHGHSHAQPSQYLHLGQALKWAYEQGHSEWTMMVEDDFTLCGQWGSSSLTRVIERLEELRPAGSPTPERLGAFVGTGGSGIIIHKTLLPLLSDFLLIHADKITPSPRPADLILQHCLTGENSLCPNSGLVISSKMIMEHKGGQYSTYRGRAYAKDKWLCGWRQPFHGRPEVDTVVV